MIDLSQNNITNEDIICKKMVEAKLMANGCAICCICGEEHGLDDINHIEIKGKTKKICKGCATAIKGIL